MNSSSDKKLVGHAFSAAFVAFVAFSGRPWEMTVPKQRQSEISNP